MRIRNVIRVGLVAALLAGGGVVLSAAPAQAEHIESCHYVDLVLLARVDYWWDMAQSLETNGGSDSDIANAYYQYMVAEDEYEASDFCA